MTKQEEIREGMAEGLFKYNNPYEEWGAMPEQTQDTFRSRADRMLLWLNGQGVVIKVDRELPARIFKDMTTYNNDYAEGYLGGQGDMLKAGYVAVEPLIKEKVKV